MADTSTAVEADGDMTTVPLGDSASGAAGGGAADLPVDPTAAAGAVTDAISVPDGWFLSPVAPITVPMGMLTFIPFDSNVKNDMMDKVDSSISIDHSALHQANHLIISQHRTASQLQCIPITFHPHHITLHLIT